MADEGDIVRSVLKHSTPGASEQLLVFWHIITEAGIGNPQLLASISDYFTNIWVPAWQLIASGASEVVDVSVDIMNPDGTVRVNVGVDPINVMGGGPIATTSAAVSGYLLAQTPLPKSRGSKYLPGIDDNQISDGLFNGAALIELLILAALYVTDMPTTVTAVLAPGILSRATGVFTEFNGEASATDVPAYQRRRKPNVGS